MTAAGVRTPARTGALLPPAQARKTVRLWLWLPLTPLFWLLSPLALLVVPLVWLTLPRRPRKPYAATFALGGVLVSLGGVVVDIDAPGARLFIRIL